MNVLKNLFHSKNSKDLINTYTESEEAVVSKNVDEEDKEWNILPELHAKSYYDEDEFERKKTVEKLIIKFGIIQQPEKGYEI